MSDKEQMRREAIEQQRRSAPYAAYIVRAHGESLIGTYESVEGARDAAQEKLQEERTRNQRNDYFTGVKVVYMHPTRQIETLYQENVWPDENPGLQVIR